MERRRTNTVRLDKRNKEISDIGMFIRSFSSTKRFYVNF